MRTPVSARRMLAGMATLREVQELEVRMWLDVPCDPPRRAVLAAVRSAAPNVREMADAFLRVRPSESWDAFLYGVMVQRAIEFGVE